MKKGDLIVIRYIEDEPWSGMYGLIIGRRRVPDSSFWVVFSSGQTIMLRAKDMEVVNETCLAV